MGEETNTLSSELRAGSRAGGYQIATGKCKTRPKLTTKSRTQRSLQQFEFKANKLTSKNSQAFICKSGKIEDHRRELTLGQKFHLLKPKETSKHRDFIEISVRTNNAAKETVPAEARSACLSLKEMNRRKVGTPEG